MPPYLTLNIRYSSSVNWSNPRNGVVPSLTPWDSSYSKGSHQVTLDNSCQLYFYHIYIYIYNGKESDSMGKIEKQSSSKVMDLLQWKLLLKYLVFNEPSSGL